MADTPTQTLDFDVLGCRDCGTRTVNLPWPLPVIGDDFDWRARDYDTIRLFMLQELSARFPERRRWTPADMEVVIVELFAALLDQLSDMADRVEQEGTLATARSPASVRRLLSFIGYDSAAIAYATGQISLDPGTAMPADVHAALEAFWFDNVFAMNQARVEGPRRIFDQERMVTLADYSVRTADHPLALRTNAASAWTGSWETISIAVILPDTAWRLDDSFDSIPQPPAGNSASDRDAQDTFYRLVSKLKRDIVGFHERKGLTVPDWTVKPTFRALLTEYVDAYRMTGQPVVLLDAVPVGIAIVASLIVQPNFYQSEIRSASAGALGDGPDGFFQAGKLRFGEDIFVSDVLAKLMAIEGVENVCMIRFKRVGNAYPDASDTGRIQLNGLEIAVCDNNVLQKARGYFTLLLHGGVEG